MTKFIGLQMIVILCCLLAGAIIREQAEVGDLIAGGLVFFSMLLSVLYFLMGRRI